MTVALNDKRDLTRDLTYAEYRTATLADLVEAIQEDDGPGRARIWNAFQAEDPVAFFQAVKDVLWAQCERRAVDQVG